MLTKVLDESVFWRNQKKLMGWWQKVPLHVDSVYRKGVFCTKPICIDTTCQVACIQPKTVVIVQFIGLNKTKHGVSGFFFLRLYFLSTTVPWEGFFAAYKKLQICCSKALWHQNKEWQKCCQCSKSKHKNPKSPVFSCVLIKQAFFVQTAQRKRYNLCHQKASKGTLKFVSKISYHTISSRLFNLI